MPEISTIPVERYTSLDPYHYTVDNRPIDGLIERLFQVNAKVDAQDDILTSAIGSAGSLAGRINVALNADGTLKTTAVDDTLHSIEEHTDTSSYVRMSAAERTKLSGIDSGATNLSVNISTISTAILFPDVGGATLTMRGSDTISWRYESSVVYADSVLGASNHVIHYYDIEPVNVSGANYKTTSSNTAYKAGTLRVFVNGLRLTEGGSAIGGYYYSEGTPASGTFTLNTTLTGGHIIRIDFDQPAV